MRYAIFIFIVGLFSSCDQSEISREPIVQTKVIKDILVKIDQEQILNTQKEKIEEEITFWKSKEEAQKGAFLYSEKIGHLYAELFKITGEVKNIIQSNEYFEKAANSTTGTRRANQLLALSSNSVKLHRFQDALEYSTDAYHEAKNKYAPALMTFDAAMELGDYEYAGEILDQYKDEKSYDYLVRYAKYLDHKGDLENAIATMEKAFELVRNKNQELYLWTLSNLGDMYGHDGQIKKSYDTYVTVLEQDPTNLHVLKGIAWIAFVNDKNYGLAKDILYTVKSNTKLPDAELILADIAEVEGNKEAVQGYKDDFMSIALHPDYQHLYATYMAELYLDESDFHKMALDIAYEEVLSRPTPETYSLLAWAHYRIGNLDEANQIITENTIGKSYEPNVVYRSGVIMAATGNKKLGRKLLKEAIDARYELGPIIADDIKEKLEHI